MDKQLLQKYLDGLCTPAELAILHDFLANEKSDLTLLKELLQSSWAKTIAEPVNEDVTMELLAKLRTRLYPSTSEATIVMMQNRRRRIWYGVAACVATLVITGTVIFRNNLFTKNSRQGIASITWKTISNNSAATRAAWLPDSSRIWLTPRSTVSYAADFTQRRSVKLEGEAFFDVKHDAAHPFLVYSNNIVTKVLGTAFNIESYISEGSIRVSLVRGRVAIEDTSSNTVSMPPALLQAGQGLTYNRITHTGNKDTLKLTELDNWTSGYLLLNDVPVTDAIARIATRFRLTIVYGNGVELNSQRVTTVFKNETPEEMLNLLLFVHHYTFRKNGNVFEIVRR